MIACVLLIQFPWHLVVSYRCWLFVYFLLRNVYSGLPPPFFFLRKPHYVARLALNSCAQAIFPPQPPAWWACWHAHYACLLPISQSDSHFDLFLHWDWVVQVPHVFWAFTQSRDSLKDKTVLHWYLRHFLVWYNSMFVLAFGACALRILSQQCLPIFFLVLL